MIDVVVAILAQLIMWPIRAGLALYFWQQIAAPRGWPMLDFIAALWIVLIVTYLAPSRPSTDK